MEVDSQGIGEGVLKDSVPETHTDYVIAVISKCGSLVSVAIIMIFLYISWELLKHFSQDNEF